MTTATFSRRRSPAVNMTGPLLSYQPVGLDLWDPKTTLESGALVRKTQHAGCPRNGTMGHTFVAAADGAFAGLVLTNSLARA